MTNYLVMPPKIFLKDYPDFLSFLESAYCIFKNDFIDSNVYFTNRKINLKKFPLVGEKEYTFYHITHSGKDENNRTPDINRIERISYPKPIIMNYNHTDIKVWANKRKGKKRILLFLESESYLVVLEERERYTLLWTAYYIEQNSRKRKLLKEYEDFKITETA